LGDDAELEAITVQQDWIDKNWPAILAADHYYTTQLGPQAINYDGQAISLNAVMLAHNARKRAIDELNLKQRTLTNQQKTCVRRIQTIAQQEMALTQASRHTWICKHYNNNIPVIPLKLFRYPPWLAI
jgi:hypothetical protein